MALVGLDGKQHVYIANRNGWTLVESADAMAIAEAALARMNGSESTWGKSGGSKG